VKDKKHWYDGIIYDKFIAPNQDRMFRIIKGIVPKESNVLDVGCGTGRLSFQLANHCKQVVGVDLSSKNISVAKSKLNNTDYQNISFVHGDGSNFNNNQIFDYAIITYVIHEMPEQERKMMLRKLTSSSKHIIIGDYLTPTPKTFWGSMNVVVEYLAGKDHYKNFKNYVKNGGLQYLSDEADLEIVREIKNQPQTSHIAILRQK